MTFSEYIEKVYDIKLLDFQKKYLEDVYTKFKNGENEPLKVVIPIGYRRIYVNGLKTLAAIHFDEFEKETREDDS